MTTRYAGWIALLAAIGVLMIGAFRGRLGEPIARGATLGIILAAAGALGGLFLTAWAFGRGDRQFLAAIVGGMLGRLAVYGGALIYVALGTTLDLLATAVGLLGFYLVCQVLEIRFFLKGLKKESG